MQSTGGFYEQVFPKNFATFTENLEWSPFYSKVKRTLLQVFPVNVETFFGASIQRIPQSDYEFFFFFQVLACFYLKRA